MKSSQEKEMKRVVGSNEGRRGRERGKETSAREKEGSSGCNFGGFLVVQVAVKNS